MAENKIIPEKGESIEFATDYRIKPTGDWKDDIEPETEDNGWGW